MRRRVLGQTRLLFPFMFGHPINEWVVSSHRIGMLSEHVYYPLSFPLNLLPTCSNPTRRLGWSSPVIVMVLIVSMEKKKKQARAKVKQWVFLFSFLLVVRVILWGEREETDWPGCDFLGGGVHPSLRSAIQMEWWWDGMTVWIVVGK